MFIGKIKYDKEHRPSVEYIGKNARVQVNPDKGNIITVWQTSTKIKNKYKGVLMEKIKQLFNDEQLKMFERLGVAIEDRAYLDGEIIELEELIAENLMRGGFDVNYKPNKEGRICESILDIFGNM